ncbi:MAG TPA: hypothetical protein DEB06_07185 [Phycisphaerales bacterium]|nr:hypothetical protein [Phycisphaerales bacterium]
MTTNGFNPRAGLALLLGVGLASAPAGAGMLGTGPITDRAHFDSIAHTLIDFETRGNATPINLIDGQTMALPVNEYAAQGVTISAGVNWVNDGTPAFNAAQNLAGMGLISIPSTSTNTFTIFFTGEVRSVAVWVANNFMVDPAGPTLTFRDAANNILRTESFGNQTGGSPFVDARVSVADYGYAGAFSQTPIASLTITKATAIVDNLIFSSAVPAPGALPILLSAALFSARRRR